MLDVCLRRVMFQWKLPYRLALAEFPHTVFSLKERVRSVCLPEAFASLQHWEYRGRNCSGKAGLTRPATPPCGHADEHVYYRACHSKSQRPGQRIHTASPGTEQHAPTSWCVLALALLVLVGVQSLLTRELGQGEKELAEHSAHKNAMQNLLFLHENLFLSS